MSPLAGLMLLAFFLLIVLSLLAWALLGPSPPRAGRGEPVGRDRTDPDRADRDRRDEDDVRVVRPSNDDLRGAKAAPKRPSVPDDAFERFLRSGRDDDR